MSRLILPCGILFLAAVLGGCSSTGDTPQRDVASDDTGMHHDILDVKADVASAQGLREAGDYPGAIRILSQLMLVYPDNAQVVAEYGKVLVLQGRTEEAIQFLRRAAVLAPNDWSVYSALGVAFDQAKDAASAKTAYDQALLLRPGEPVVLNNYAMSRMLAGDLPGAARLIAQAQKSGDPKVAKNAALIAELSGHAPEAAAPPEAATKHTPKPIATVQPLPPPAPGVPRPLQTPAKAASTTASPTHPSTIVMQAVPADPKAGSKPAAPALKAKRKPHGYASAAQPAPTALKTSPETGAKAIAVKATPEKKGETVTKADKKEPADGIPALRLANDRL